MPVPVQRDPDTTARALEGWLERLGLVSCPSVANLRGPAATGYSHETIIFDASDDAGTRTLVARVAPTTHTVFLDPVFEHEFEVMDGLAGRAAVPDVLAIERDDGVLGAPFFVMEHVPGEIPPDNPPYTFGGWLAEASPAQQERAWWSGIEAMCEVHLVRPDRFGFLPMREPGLDYEVRSHAWATAGTAFPLADRALRWLSANEPSQGAPALCWGDARLGNQIFRDFECVALLDWEMAVLGDPVADLAWWLYFDRAFSEGLGAPRPAGFPSHADTVARYEEITGRRVENLGYWLVYAGYRFAVIMLRLSGMMKTYEQLPPDSDFGTNSFATQTLERVLAEVAGIPA